MPARVSSRPTAPSTDRRDWTRIGAGASLDSQVEPVASDPCLDDDIAAAFVDRALGSARTRLVEAHLDRCPSCRLHVADLVRDGTSDTSMSDATADARPLDLLRPGDHLGRYELQRTLGAGGMGVVWLARDPELLRLVALKVPRRTLLDSADTARAVRREARALARVRDARIVEIYDVGEDAGRGYIAMRFIDGLPLHVWAVERRPRWWREILRTCIEAGRGVAAAHRASLLHRDLKPSNIMVDGDGRAFVTDFGLSVALDDRTPSEAAHTSESRTSARGGTPGYLAPELASGELGDARADQYSLALTFHEALTGQRASSGTSRVPRALLDALQRAMAMDPAARYATVDDMLDTLARAAGSRRRLAAAAALVGVGVLAVAWPSDSPPSPPAVLEDLDPSPDNPNGFDSLIKQVDATRRSGWPQTAVVLLEHARALAESADDDGARAWVRFMAGWLAEDRGDRATALAEFAAAAVLAESAGRDRLTVEIRIALMTAAAYARRDDEVPALESAAWAALERAGNDAVQEAWLELSLGDIDVLRTRSEPALAHYRRAQSLLSAVPSDSPKLQAQLQGHVWVGRGNALGQLGRHEEAEVWFRRALELAERDESLNDIATVLLNLAMTLVDRGAYLEALAMLERARVTTEQANGPVHVSIIVCEAHLSTVLRQLGRPTDAEQHAREALRIAAEIDIDEHLYAHSLGALARAVAASGRLDEAAALMQRALVLNQSKFGAAHWQTIVCLIDLGRLETERGRFAAAGERLDQAQATVDAGAKAFIDDLSNLRAAHGELALRRGDLDRAADELTAALEIGTRGRDAPVHAMVHVGLAEIELARGQPDAARDRLQRTLHVLDAAGVKGSDWAEVAFTLARAIAAIDPRSAEARELAARAREERQSIRGAEDPRVREMAAWRAQP